MPKQPEDASPDAWHRYFAMEFNNRAWDLSVRERTPGEDAEMLSAAHASALHWSAIGTDLNRMRAKLLLAEVHALLGMADTAMAHANDVRRYFLDQGAPDWEIAFVHAIHAHAAAVSHDPDAHRDSYARAVAAIDAIADDEDRRIVLETFRQVPRP